MKPVAIIPNTRIYVWSVVQAKNLGMTDTDILSSYPSITAASLATAFDYAKIHADEIAVQIHENEAA